MMSLVAVAAALLLAVVAASAQSVPAVSYQIHSYDDLREWPSVLAKGANWLKVDFHYQSPTWCASQSRVVDPSLGCYVLNHDTPISTRTDYNTSDDILSIVMSGELAPYFTGAVNGPIHIALCAKYDLSKSICDGSTLAGMAISLFDKFFENAQSILPQLNVTFILDGSFTPTKGSACLINKWRPWLATWIVGSDPASAAKDNNATNGDDRFQINNMPEGIPSLAPSVWLELMQLDSYGKFLHNPNALPFLFWEPSDQKSILSVVHQYMKGPFPVVGNQPTLRFAINIDPVQFTVFSSNTIVTGPTIGAGPGGAWNIGLIAGAELSEPIVSVDGNCGMMYVLYQYANGGVNQVLYSVYRVAGPLGALIPQVQQQLLYTITTPGVTVTSVSAVAYNTAIQSSIVLVSLSNGVAWTGFGNSTGLSLTSPLQLNTDANLVSSTVMSSHDDSTTLIAQAYSTPQCALMVQAFKYGIYQYNAKPLGAGICLFHVDSSDLGSTSITSSSVSLSGTFGAIAYGTTSAMVYVALYEMSASQGIINLSAPVYVTVGATPSISSTYHVASGSVATLLTSGAGYCWNNEVDNKRDTPALCESTPVSLPYVLTYTYGLSASWNDFVFVNTPTGGVNSCNAALLHGTYDWGSTPASTLWSTQTEVGVAAVHIGLPASGVKDTNDCGIAVPFDGIVLDGWQLPTLTGPN